MVRAFFCSPKVHFHVNGGVLQLLRTQLSCTHTLGLLSTSLIPQTPAALCGGISLPKASPGSELGCDPSSNSMAPGNSRNSSGVSTQVHFHMPRYRAISFFPKKGGGWGFPRFLCNSAQQKGKHCCLCRQTCFPGPLPLPRRDVFNRGVLAPLPEARGVTSKHLGCSCFDTRGG